jgi:hypothetical protein
LLPPNRFFAGDSYRAIKNKNSGRLHESASTPTLGFSPWLMLDGGVVCIQYR